MKRRARLRELNTNGNGMGTPLAMAAQLWARPTARDYRTDSTECAFQGSEPVARQALRWADGLLGGTTPTVGRTLLGYDRTWLPWLNPTFVEWLMGLPIGWTAFDALETQSFPHRQRPHSECSREES